MEVPERTLNVPEEIHLLVNRVNVSRGSRRYNIDTRDVSRKCVIDVPKFILCTPPGE